MIWYCRLFGTPYLERAEHRARHLGSRTAWLLLAYLVLENPSPSRDEIREKLFDNKNKYLRQDILLLKKALGEEILHTTGTTLTLLPESLTTDFQRFQTKWQKALQVQELAPRAESLQEALQLLNGDFLDRCDPSFHNQWLEDKRKEMNTRHGEYYVQLALVYEELGDWHSAASTIRHALELAPGSEQAKTAFLRLSPHTTTEMLEVALVAPNPSLHLRQLLQHKKPTKFREQPHFSIALKRLMATLPSEERKAFIALSIFPQPFLEEQAVAVTQVDFTQLEAFTKSNLLQTIVVNGNVRYSMASSVREWSKRQLTPVEYKRLVQRHKNYFTPILLADRGDTPRDDALNMRLCADWYLNRTPTKEEAFILFQACTYAKDYACISDLKKCISYLSRLTPTLEFPLQTVIASCLSAIALYQKEYKRAIHWVQYAYKSLPPQEPEYLSYLSLLLKLLLTATHHHNSDSLFDQATDLVQSIGISNLPYLDQPAFHYIIAENKMARRQWSEALASNKRALELRIEQNRTSDLPATYYQQGAICLSLEDQERAARAWEIALDGFESQKDEHGMADCQQSLGLLLAKQGTIRIGRLLVEQAINLYTKIGATQSRAAALSTLAEIQCLAGEKGTAQQLWQEGLQYWESTGHERWVTHFRSRLERL